MSWITAELYDVLLNPFEDLALVAKTVVGFEMAIFAVAQESVRAHSIVEGDDDNLVPACRYQAGAV